MKKEKQPFDFTKYGFKLHYDGGDCHVYRTLNKDTVELFIMGNSVSIDIITDGKERIPICNHYKCATNAQIKFLILNGKAGFWIKEAMRDMKIE